MGCQTVASITLRRSKSSPPSRPHGVNAHNEHLVAFLRSVQRLAGTLGHRVVVGEDHARIGLASGAHLRSVRGRFLMTSHLARHARR